MHAALNKRTLKLSLTFGDLYIGLSLANAAHASSILTLTSRKDVKLLFCRSNLESDVFEVVEFFDWLALYGKWISR